MLSASDIVAHFFLEKEVCVKRKSDAFSWEPGEDGGTCVTGTSDQCFVGSEHGALRINH